MDEIVIKKKRGRKSKKELELLKLQKLEEINDLDNNTTEIKIDLTSDTNLNRPKKRGRKPKGGKIIKPTHINNDDKSIQNNIILQLKCSLNDILLPNTIDIVDNTKKIEEQIEEQYKFNFNNNMPFDTYTFNSNKELNYEIIKNNKPTCKKDTYKGSNKCNNKDILEKLKVLNMKFQNNDISNKTSACFWCTYNFDNIPIHIPKFSLNDSYHVYGCFCSPECATGYLMNEHIDSSIKFERYFLLNSIYSKIYGNDNIKPAPDPVYTLEKFYGSLTINEYRMLHNNKKMFIVIDKPITRVLPEIHEENDDFIINNKIIPSNNYNSHKKKEGKINTLLGI